MNIIKKFMRQPKPHIDGYYLRFDRCKEIEEIIPRNDFYFQPLMCFEHLPFLEGYVKSLLQMVYPQQIYIVVPDTELEVPEDTKQFTMKFYPHATLTENYHFLKNKLRFCISKKYENLELGITFLRNLTKEERKKFLEIKHFTFYNLKFFDGSVNII